jgi:hypothetical protein
VPEGFDLAEHIGLPRWRYRKGGSPFTAKVWFDREVWWWVKDNWGCFGMAEDEPEGGTLCVEVEDTEAFLGAVLELGLYAEVKGPPFLRKKMVEALEQVLEAH